MPLEEIVTNDVTSDKLKEAFFTFCVLFPQTELRQGSLELLENLVKKTFLQGEGCNRSVRKT